MNATQRIEVRMAQRRGELAELVGDGTEAPDDARVERIDALTVEQRRDDSALTAAKLAEPDAAPVIDADPARLELRAAARIGDFIGAALGKTRLEGASAELAVEHGCALNQIPFEAFGPVETRNEASPAPSAGTGVNLAPIEAFVFAGSIGMDLGISMPSVPSGTYSVPVITTALTADAKAKGAAAASSAAAISLSAMTPKRVSARLTFRLEDAAMIGRADFESALRKNLQAVMSDALDTRILNDQDATANPEEPNGLIAALGPLTAATDVVTFESGIAALADLIDGKWSRSLAEIRAVVNATVMSKYETLFQQPAGNTGAKGSGSLASFLRSSSAGLSAHSRMPAAASNVSACVAFLAGAGLMEARPTTAVCANWGRVEITDPFSSSASAETAVTAHVLVSDVKVLHTDAYSLFSIKTA